MSQQDQTERYLRTGGHDVFCAHWPGANFLECARNADQALRQALISAVKDRSQSARMPAGLLGLDVEGLARRKVSPMVQGLFPAVEQQPIIEVLSHSVVFLDPGNIEPVLSSVPFLRTAWDLANLYLLSCDACPLSDEAVPIVGFSEGKMCYVSMAYLQTQGRLEDFLVHEAAHVFHNCRRATLGLSNRGKREWLLSIDYYKRETFAYACEAYSRIIEIGATRAARVQLAAEITDKEMPPDDRVDTKDYRRVLGEAVEVRNGWRRILASCAPASQLGRLETCTATPVA